MRRLVITTLLATVLLGAAACGAKTDENPTAATTSSAPATAGPTTAPGDTVAACAAFQSEWLTHQVRALEIVTGLIGAGQDKAKAEKASTDIKQLFTEMRASADKHLASAANAEFKAALTTYSEQLKNQSKAVEAAGQDAEKLMDAINDEAFQAAVDKLTALCGG